MRTKVVVDFRYAANDPSVLYEPGDVPGENDKPPIGDDDVESLIAQGFLEALDADQPAKPSKSDTP